MERKASSPSSAETIRANYERIKAELGPEVTIVAATKYVDDLSPLVEVNLSGEETKSGIPESELESFLGLYDDVRGLMTMPPETGDPEASRPYFRRLRELAERYGLRELSMGTSQDYRVAADEGATMVRLGSVLYGR